MDAVIVIEVEETNLEAVSLDLALRIAFFMFLRNVLEVW